MSIKVSIKKLKLAMSFKDLVKREINGNAIELIGILPEHLDALAELSFHHKDPFDRLIISQSLVENMPIITRDAAFSNYPITLIW
jgi:PIN domain nuclease of toxin-antitoxin system